MTSNHLVLYHLAELMLENEQHVLAVDTLFDDDVIADFVKSIQIDSPYQQMLLEGVLTESVRDEKLFVSFTVEGYFHYVLGEVIYNRTEGLGADALKLIIEGNKLNGSKEGVEQCLIRNVQKGDLTRLIWLIDESDKSLELAVLPLSIAFLSFKIRDVLSDLLISPTINDLILVGKVCSFFEINLKTKLSEEIKEGLNEIDKLENLIVHPEKIENAIEVKDQVKLLGQLNIKLSDETKERKIQKIIDFILFFLKNESSNNTDCLDWISILVDLNALDQAKQYYTKFIEETEKRGDKEALVLALEQLGDSEYKRSGQDGYKAAMDALTRAAEIRESEAIPQKDKLKNTYHLLGFAYLSLGLQVVKSIEYLEKAKSIMLEEASDSAELAEINFYIGLVYYWRGLMGTGRWGHADPSLLEGVDFDLFDCANSQYSAALSYYEKKMGATHPKTQKIYIYLYESSYALAYYEKSIIWLKKYVRLIQFKDPEPHDNNFKYALIVSIEEHAKQLALTDPQKALALIQEALQYILNYDEGAEIANRLSNVKKQIETGKIEEPVYTRIEQLPPLETETQFKGVWSKWQFSDELKGFHTNNWMVAENGVWFFNGEKKRLVFWDKEKNSLSTFQPTNWPEGCGRLVYDQKNRLFYAWSSIRSTVFELSSPEGNWNRLSYGVNDVHACGASFAFDPINNRLFEFGGYGYFTYKNWLWVYDIDERKWIQLKENRPGISPYPRNGQLLPIENGNKALLISGIGSDTGIQREHKARLGLASATDVGYFTWLRDAHELDLAKMEWKTVLHSNHESIRHEGAFGFIHKLNLVLNWAGIVPSPTFGVEAEKQSSMSCWQLENESGFNFINYEGIIPPMTEGSFLSVNYANNIFYIHDEGIWKLSIYDL